MLSPILAGYLLESGLALPNVAMVMGIGSAVAALVLLAAWRGSLLPSRRAGGPG
jgi:hypothetical protein